MPPNFTQICQNQSFGSYHLSLLIFIKSFWFFLGEKLLLLIIFETLYLVKMGQIFVTTTLLIKNTDLSFKLTWSLLGKNLLDSIKVDFSSNISTYIYWSGNMSHHSAFSIIFCRKVKQPLVNRLCSMYTVHTHGLKSVIT